ncbi:MAG: 30S ribosomal protein S1 [Planctomycetes bacterium]|nr:30S ribosomal protein S1 [Planctomycetota bacterium]
MNTDIPLPEVGSLVRGRVVRLTERGAMIELTSGLKGLIHCSLVSWTERRADVRDTFKLGDEAEAVVVEVKRSKKTGNVFMTLGYRQLHANPWAGVTAAHPVGSRAAARVVEFLTIGAIIQFESGFRGLVHNNEVSWTERKPRAIDFLRVGQFIEVVVTFTDPERRRIHASYRQTQPNPWDTFLEQHPIGSVTRGRVDLVRPFGVFVMLPNGCVGLLHNTQFPPGVTELLVGEAVMVNVLAFDREKQRIMLSARPTAGS